MIRPLNDPILPIQFARARQKSWAERLLCAILEEAIYTFLKHDPDRVTRRNYWHWERYQRDYGYFVSTSEHFGSFLFCCEHLSIDPDRLRAAVLSTSGKVPHKPTNRGYYD